MKPLTKSSFFKFLFLTFFTLLNFKINSQTMPVSGTNIGASSGTWTVPANVYSIKIDAWGGGGAGAGQSTSGTGGLAGGAGGSRSTTTISVTPGQTIWYSVVVQVRWLILELLKFVIHQKQLVLVK